MAYQNSLMVQIWSALAAKDTRLFCAAMNRFPAKPPTTVWGTYLRCHDDIGWAIDDARRGVGRAERLRAPPVPRRLLRRRLPDERRARAGVPGEPGDRRPPDQRHGGLADRDRGRAGTAATRPISSWRSASCSLAHAIVLGYGGLPLLYMGDELGAAQRLRLRRRPRARRRQPLGPPAPDAVGRRRAPARGGHARAPGLHGLRHLRRASAPRCPPRGVGRDRGPRPGEPGRAGLPACGPTQTMVAVHNVTAEPQTLPRWVDPGRQLGLGRADRGDPADRRPAVPGAVRGPLVRAADLTGSGRRCGTRADPDTG